MKSKFNLDTQFPVCCIYHKPKRFDESSDEDSSDSDSDSSCDHNYPSHRHSHGHRNRTRAPRGDGGAAETRGNQGVGVVYQLEDNSESNAYEIIPASRKGKRKGGTYSIHHKYLAPV